MVQDWRRASVLRAASSIVVAVLTGCTGVIGERLQDGVGQTSADALVCDPTAAPAPSPLKRLSNQQYQNTLRDLFTGSALDGVLQQAQAASPSFDALPRDGDVADTFGVMDGRLADVHMDVYFNVADAIATAASSTPARRAALAGACINAATVSAACADTFIRSFGLRAYRRPLTEAEVTRMRELAPSNVSGEGLVGDVVFSMLMAPQFIYRFENGGAALDAAQTRFALTDYELAARLSFHFWQTTPDDELLEAAATGALSTTEGFSAQVERLADHPRARESLRTFFDEWYELVAPRTFPNTPLFQAAFAGVSADGALYGEMVDEVHDLIDYVLDSDGGYRDLLTSDAVTVRSPRVAALYGVSPWDGVSPPASFPEGERSGVLTRAALLLQTSGRTNPILRGARIRKEILCDSIKVPPDLPSEALTPPPLDPSATTRERFDAKTSAPACNGCHTVINPLGYALELYDGLGRYRTVERVLEDDGSQIASLPIDPVIEPRLVPDDSTVASNPAELMSLVAETAESDVCFALHYFRYAFRRDEVRRSDGCALIAIRDAATGGSLLDALRAVAYTDAFKQRVMGAP